MPSILCTHQLADNSVLQEFPQQQLPRGTPEPSDATKTPKTFKAELRARLHWWSCGHSDVDGTLLLESVGLGFKCSVGKNSPFSQVLFFFLYLHVVPLLQQRMLEWCPAQFHKLAHADMVKDAVWVNHFFSYFVQHKNNFIRLRGWLLYSLFPFLKLKQQRDDSELPAWKIEVSSKNFNTGLLIK